MINKKYKLMEYKKIISKKGETWHVYTILGWGSKDEATGLHKGVFLQDVWQREATIKDLKCQDVTCDTDIMRYGMKEKVIYSNVRSV